MTTLNFAAQVDGWAKKAKARLEAVFQTSAERVSEAVQNGTPIDTGFLVHSWAASAGGMPKIIAGSRPPSSAGKASYKFDAGPINLIISNVPLGGTVYFGFTAGYAPHVEYGANGRAGRAMVRLAAQRWPQIVKEAVSEAKARVGKGSGRTP